jgi:hypothetical protein
MLDPKHHNSFEISEESDEISYDVKEPVRS